MKNVFGFILGITIALFATLSSAATPIISWDNVVGNEGYVVQRSLTTCATVSSWGNAGTVAADVVTFTDQDFAAGTELCYRIGTLKGGVAEGFSALTDTQVPLPLPGPANVTVTYP